jgi:glutamate carboxypeptidase
VIDDAIGWLRGRGAEMERCLAALVERTSYSGDRAGAAAVGEVLRGVVPLGCEAVPSEAFGAHLFFSGAGGAASGGAMLVGHLDTVFPAAMFSGYRVEGRIARGPGVLDMKGGLVVVAFALQALQQADLLGRIPLTFAVVADEEVGSPDSAPALRARTQGAACALVFEAGRVGDAIITRRKGVGRMRATAAGRAAHAGNDHAAGANALWGLARFVDAAQSLTDYSRDRTVNVGRMEGGLGTNTVPDTAWAALEYRYATEADGEALRAGLHTAAEGHGVAGVTVSLVPGTTRPSLERTPASADLCAAYGRHQRDAGLGFVEAALVGGGSDAAHTAAVGVPSLDGLGPRGRGFHTLDEYVELDTLVPKAEALVRFLSTLART